MKKLFFMLIALFIALPIRATVTITAGSGGATITLVSQGSVDASHFKVKYKYQGNRYTNTWTKETTWNAGSTSNITISIYEGKQFTIYTSDQNSTTCVWKDEDNYRRIVITGSATVSGNLKDLTGGNEWVSNCMRGFFMGSTGLTSVSGLSFPTDKNTVPNGAFQSMFQGCTKLVDVPSFNINDPVLGTSCYESMFEGCEALKQQFAIKGGNNNGVTLAASCCKKMYKGCISLESAATFKAKNDALPASCLESMYEGCSNLTEAPELNAAKMGTACYRYMFRNCTKLEVAPALPASTLAESCYYGMFMGCTALKASPGLVAGQLYPKCYMYMFKNCSSLEFISVDLTDWDEEHNCTTNWVEGVGTSGYFMGPEVITAYPLRNKSHVPVGWKAGAPDYFWIKVGNTSDKASIQLTRHGSGSVKLQYSNDCKTWKEHQEDASQMLWNVVSCKKNDIIYIRSKVTSGTLSTSASDYWTFDISDCDGVTIGGNIMSLLDYTSTRNEIPDYAFYKLFESPVAEEHGYYEYAGEGKGNYTIQVTDVGWGKGDYGPKDYYPVKTYQYVGNGNGSYSIVASEVEQGSGNYKYSKVVTGSKIDDISELRIPVVSVGNHACDQMFINANKITVAPSLPATSLGEYCYQSMFENCTKLSACPDLPATTLKTGCYKKMFRECDAIYAGPTTLPAETLVNECYEELFYGCGNLRYIDVAFLDWNCDKTEYLWVHLCNYGHSNFRSTKDWVTDVNNKGTFIISKDAACRDQHNGGNMVPQGWTGNDICQRDGQDYLCFIATAGATTLKLTSDNPTQAPNIDVEWQKNGVSSTVNSSTGEGGWKTWSSSDAITLSQGDFVFFRSRKNGKQTVERDGNGIAINRVFYNANGHWHFTATNKVAVRGTIMSIVHNQCGGNDINKTASANAFRGLFENCTGITSCPKLPATTVGDYAYASMFKGCTGLTNGPEMNATTLGEGCYQSMFEGCTNLQEVSPLPAEKMAQRSYEFMFRGCSRLTSAPALPATTLADYCYHGMFSSILDSEGTIKTAAPAITRVPALTASKMYPHCYEEMFKDCKNIVVIPDLPATRLSGYCYSGMFKGCTSLTSAPELLATTLSEYCYYQMFMNAGLQSAPILPAKALKEGCYKSMFEGCSSLCSAPELPAVTLQRSCYERMFYGCSNMTNMKVGFNAWPEADLKCTYKWVNGVAKMGSFICSKALQTSLDENGKYDSECSYLPRDPQYKWRIINDYLCFTNYQAQQAVVSLKYATTLADEIFLEYWSSSNMYASYSEYQKDGGVATEEEFNEFTDAEKVKDWQPYTSETEIKLNTFGDKVFFRAQSGKTNVMSNNYNNGDFSQFVIPSSHKKDGKTIPNNVAVSGDLRSLISENYEAVTAISSYGFYRLFFNCYGLIDASSLKLPAFTSTGSYSRMFQSCIHLTEAPSLPATRLSTECYKDMFNYCYNLTTAPALPATRLAGACYRNMFYKCYALESAPALPATTLANRCYQDMFKECTSLTKSPYLPAANLNMKSCYSGMFTDCTSLRSIEVNFTDWNPSGFTTTEQPTYNWVSTWGGDADNPAGDFRCPSTLENKVCDTSEQSGIPRNWSKALNIIAVIPDESGTYPVGFNVQNSLLKHGYQFTASSEELDVIYCEGNTSMTLTIPDYAKVQCISIEGTTEDGTAGRFTVSYTDKDAQTRSVTKDINRKGGTPSTLDFTIDDPGTIDSKNQVQTFTLTVNHGFYGKITLYGDSKPYCDAPMMRFDYEENVLYMSALDGATIYYSTDPDCGEAYVSVYNETNKAALNKQLADWVNAADGFGEITYYAYAKFDDNDDVKPSVINSVTIGRYAPKLTGYCLVEDGNAENFMDALRYAMDAASNSYPVKIYVPEGVYDLGSETAEVNSYVTIAGDGVNKTIIRGNGDPVMSLVGHDAYLQDIAIVQTGSGNAMNDDDLNVRKVKITGKYYYKDNEVNNFTQWSDDARLADGEQVNIKKVTLNGETYSAQVENGKTTSLYLYQVYNGSGNLEAYTMVESSDFYIKHDLVGKTASVRAVNAFGGFGAPCTAEKVVQLSSNEATFTDASGKVKTFTLNSSGFATFSHGEEKNVQVIGASAYYAKFQGDKIRLTHVNDKDVILRSEANENDIDDHDKRGVIIFGTPGANVHFYYTTETPAAKDNELYANYKGNLTNTHYKSGSDQEGIWILNGDKVQKLKGAPNFVYKHRSYFDFPITTSGSSSQPSSGLRVAFGYWDDVVESSIEEVLEETLLDQIDRPILITTGAYDLLGRKVETRKGLLIKDGKVILQK